MEPITETNFFSLILPYLVKGMDLTLTMRADDGKITVGIRPNHSGVKDENFRKIPSLVLTHSSGDLDKSFFATIAAPLDSTQQLAEALQAWEAKFQVVKGEVDKKIADKPEPAKAAPKGTPKKKKVTSVKPKAKAGLSEILPKKEKAPKVNKTEMQKTKYAELTSEALRLLEEKKFDEGIKEATRLLKLPPVAGSRQDSLVLIKKIKDAKLSDRCLALTKEYESISNDAEDREKQVSEVRKKMKGLMGVDRMFPAVIEIVKYIHEQEEAFVKMRNREQASKMIANARPLIAGQDFVEAFKILKEVKKIDRENPEFLDILSDLEGKLGKDFIATTFK